MKRYKSERACRRLGKNFRSGALYQKALRRKQRNAAKPRQIDKIIILGDSVAYGYGTKGGIARHLEDSFPDSEVLNFGINGLTSDGLVERLRANHWQAELAHADLVLLNIGGNDLLRQYQGGGAGELIRQFAALKKKYRRNLLEIYGTIQKGNEQVLIVQNSLYNSMKKKCSISVSPICCFACGIQRSVRKASSFRTRGKWGKCRPSGWIRYTQTKKAM